MAATVTETKTPASLVAVRNNVASVIIVNIFRVQNRTASLRLWICEVTIVDTCRQPVRYWNLILVCLGGGGKGTTVEARGIYDNILYACEIHYYYYYTKTKKEKGKSLKSRLNQQV